MKKDIPPDDDEMPAEFDFSKSIANPWFVAVHGPEYVRVIDKDLAGLFPDDRSMNDALRSIAQAAARVPKKSAQELSLRLDRGKRKEAAADLPPDDPHHREHQHREG